MARRRRHRQSTPTRTFSVGREVAKRPPSLASKLPRQIKRVRVDLRLYDDMRTNYPSPVRPAFSIPRSASRLVIRNANKERVHSDNGVHGFPGFSVFTPPLASRIGFAEPRSVVMCVRRHRRREVLFALRGGRGKSISRFRKVRRNEWSEVSC